MDELYSRVMPHSAEAEQSVIGSMLIDSGCIPEVLELLRPEDFYVGQNVAIFETVLSMFTNAKVIDPITVLDALVELGHYDEAGGRQYLTQVMEVTPTSANVRSYCRIIKDKRLLRGLASAGREISDMAFTGEGDAAQIAEAAEQQIYNVRQGRDVKGLHHIGSVLLEVYESLNVLAKNGGLLPGIPSGLVEVDSFLTGLNKSDLILIASRPGMGKTSIALNIALHATKQSGKAVVIFQLEMSREQVARRMISSEASIDSRKLKTGDLDENDWLRLAQATNVLSKTKIFIDDNSAITVTEMKAKCRRLGDQLGLVVIDYLQLMQSGGRRSENRVNEVAEISRGLKIMAKELDVPVLCCAQLSRAAEQRADKRPMLSDLRESGSIEQDADIVMFLYRDDYYDKETDEKNVAECIIAKNRHGSTGTVKLHWHGEYTRFVSQDRIHNESGR